MACGSDPVTGGDAAADAMVDAATDTSTSTDAGSDATSGDGGSSALLGAFIYQDVTQNTNNNRIGLTSDGKLIDAYQYDILKATKGGKVSYGDPTFTRLSNGRWAMTAWTGFEDTHGSNQLMYHEAACPNVVDADVKTLGAKTAVGCKASKAVTGGKTSQIFEVNGSNYVFSNINGELYMTRLTDSTHKATDLDALCIKETAPTKLADLAWGETMLAVSKTLANGILLSDSGIARRKDGTWVLFLKGYPTTAGCTGPGLCELCARGIYRSTSTDLITWTTPVKLFDKASVPDATTYPDGSVWVYWQDFTATCAAQDEKLAQRAPISGAYELADLTLSTRVAVSIPKEAFETDTKLHYPTNGNPIPLPDNAAKAALEACLK